LEPDALDFIRANPGVECSTEPPLRMTTIPRYGGF